MTEYFKKLTSAKDRVVEELQRRGADPRYLQFGGPGDPLGRVFVPTGARSEFLANRAMGDWAEHLLAGAINSTVPGYRVVHYGNSDRISANEEGFPEFYKSTLEDVRVFGKRPDILIVPDSYTGLEDVSDQPTEALRPLVVSALAAVEVRSSKYEALHYARVRSQERQAGKLSGRESQSFTVKIEDLKIVYRWIENFQKPQAYCQVFFDSMFAINVLRIFEIIGRGGKGFQIENPAKSQEKTTIMIPITSGLQVASFGEQPTFEVEHQVTRHGRHDAFVRPVGGDVKFDPDAFLKALVGIEPTPPRSQLL